MSVNKIYELKFCTDLENLIMENMHTYIEILQYILQSQKYNNILKCSRWSKPKALTFLNNNKFKQTKYNLKSNDFE